MSKLTDTQLIILSTAWLLQERTSDCSVSRAVALKIGAIRECRVVDDSVDTGDGAHRGTVDWLAA
jgi:hypothetical protein